MAHEPYVIWLIVSNNIDHDTVNIISECLNSYNSNTSGSNNDLDLLVVSHDNEGTVASDIKSSLEYTRLFVE